MSAARAAAACAHCGEPVRAAAARAAEPAFCCVGCAAAYELLRAADLGDFYALRDRLQESGVPVRPSGRSYVEFDDAVVLEAAAPTDARGRRQVRLLLGGMHCTACVWLVERGLGRWPGVRDVRVDLGRGTVELSWRQDQAPLSELLRWLDRLGYRPELYREAAADAVRRREDRDLWLRLGVAGAAAGNLMLLAVPLYVGAWSGIAREHAAVFRWWSLIVALPVVFFSAMPFHRAAWGALRARMLHIDLPISLAVWIAFAGSAWATIRGQGEVFFDSLAGLVFLLLIGRLVLLRGRRRAQRAADTLLNLAAPTARLVANGTVREVATERIVRGDVVEVLPGGSPPVDGVVVAGRALVDLHVLTGESLPVAVSEGERLVAGAVVLDRPLRLRAEAVGAERRLQQIAELARTVAARRAPVVRLADRLAGAFTAVTLVASSATALVWAWHGAAAALSHGVAVAVVLCPCALGLATPLALAVAHGRAARRGIMVKGGDAVEALAGVRTIVLDKTGTLTAGRPEVVGVQGMAALDGQPLVDFVAALERHSQHPVARALVLAGDGGGITVEDVQETFGGGIAGTVGGRALRVGTEAFCGGLPAKLHQAAPPQPGASPVAVAVDGRAVALLWVADPLQAEAAATVARLRAAGLQTVLLSGDAEAPVRAVAQAVGIDRWIAAAGPEEKVRVIGHLRRDGAVAMVGDGANDAAALAAADVGIAVRGSAEAALAAGDAYVLDGGVAAVAELLGLSRRALATVRRNVALSVVYNVAGGTAAALGLIGPLAAAVLMPLSSLTVVLSSLWQREARP